MPPELSFSWPTILSVKKLQLTLLIVGVVSYFISISPTLILATYSLNSSFLSSRSVGF